MYVFKDYIFCFPTQSILQLFCTVKENYILKMYWSTFILYFKDIYLKNKTYFSEM